MCGDQGSEKRSISDIIPTIGKSAGVRGITVLDSGKPGLSVGLMGFLHGNELAGKGLWQLLQFVGPPTRGRIYLIVGHPDALFFPHRPVRCIERDINRMFVNGSYDADFVGCSDHKRCLELKAFFEELDILVDIHSTAFPSEPFVAVPGYEVPHLELSMRLPITRVFGLERFVPGTASGWINSRGGTGITIEVGQHNAPYGDLIAGFLTQQILLSLDMAASEPIALPVHLKFKKRNILIIQKTLAQGFEFSYNRSINNFEKVQPGELIGKDEFQSYNAPMLDNLRICLPTDEKIIQKRLSDEAFYLGVGLEDIDNILVKI